MDNKVLLIDKPITISRHTRLWISNKGEKDGSGNTFTMAGMMYDQVEIMVNFDGEGLLQVSSVGASMVLFENRDFIPSPRFLLFTEAAINAPGQSIDIDIPAISTATTQPVLYRLSFFYENAEHVRITLKKHPK